MKYKKLFLFFAIIAFNCNTYSQPINCNPDPNGQPWWAGGDIVPTPEEWDQIPLLELTPESVATDLPPEVDNSILPYFPPIFYQIGNSCAQASGIGYIFTYEIDRARNLPANVTENQYPHLYTYNFLYHNSFSGNGSTTQEGWNIAIENGIPKETDYDNPFNWEEEEVLLFWMSGFEKYKSAMNNRISEYYHIDFDIDGTDFNLLIHWINDHGTGASTGGLGKISVQMFNAVYEEYPDGSPEEYKMFVKQWGTSGPHAMTIVGYNYNVRYDFNDDGEFTNHLDINNDQIVNMLDWEIGALKLANSWGEDWENGNEGFVYMPYCLFETFGGPTSSVLVCEVEDSPSPEIVIKSKVYHERRTNFGFGVAWGEYANSNVSPGSPVNGNSFWLEGGPYKINGYNNNPLEFAFDFGHYFADEDFGKVFIELFNQNSTFNAEFDYLSMIDYRWGEDFELYYSDTPFNVGFGFHELGIPYDLIVPGDDQIIDENVSLFSNMVSRFNPTVINGVTITVEDGVEIDMYDSQLIIEEGATLIIDDNVVFTGKVGECNILVYGSMQVGQNVSFDGVDITIYNSNHQTTFQNCTFNSSALINGGSALTIVNSDFTDCDAIWSINGDITITGSNLYCTWLLLENMAGVSPNIVNVSNNNIWGSYGCQSGIYISDYDNFFVENNTIDNCGIGIQVYESGGGASGNQSIYENEILNCNDKAVLVYNSTASIAGNYVHDNNKGVWLANSSNVALYGNAGAQTYAETQQIIDNSSYEIYSSRHSFPWYFRHNAIIDEDNVGNPSDPMLYYDSPCTQQKDIRYNCWGNNFMASEDLSPSQCFIYTPFWCPKGTVKEASAAEQLYVNANTQFETGNYTNAKTSYQSLINLYPETEFAQASMKDLLSLEKFVDNDYNGLKQYYATNTSIQMDSTLSELAAFYSNKCDIVLENWQVAISHYEGIINNPPTPEDSIYAIIDLGYTYILMQNSGYKSYHSGMLTEHIPTSREHYIDRRKYNLSLFPLSKEMKPDAHVEDQIEGKLLQNVPNPFSSSTTIHFELYGRGNINIKIFNHLGKEVWVTEKSDAAIGGNEIEFSASDLPTGIYFYALFVNGVFTDSKKMILVK